MAQDLEELKERLRKWKRDMEAKGMRVNLGKTKVMWGGGGLQEGLWGKVSMCGV